MEKIVKIKINSVYSDHFKKFLEDSYFVSVIFEIVPDTSHRWKFQNEDLFIITILPEVQERADTNFKFWFGYHFSHHLQTKGINPLHAI